MIRGLNERTVWGSCVPCICVDLHRYLECGRGLRMGELRKDASLVEIDYWCCSGDCDTGWQRLAFDTPSLAHPR
jgi:hypothetical protein